MIRDEIIANPTQNSVALNDGPHTSLITSNGVNLSGEVPYVGKEFSSHEDAYHYYNAYALKMGFGIRRESMDKSRKASTPGIVVSRTFVCNKAGRKKSDKRQLGKLVHRRPDTRVGCPARMNIKLSTSNTWMVHKFIEEHQNHQLCSSDKVAHHYSHKQNHRSQITKTWIERCHGAGMCPSHIARVLNVGMENQFEEVTTQQCIDHIRAIKSNIGDPSLDIFKTRGTPTQITILLWRLKVMAHLEVYFGRMEKLENLI